MTKKTNPRLPGIILCLFSIILLASAPPAARATEWTFMVYMDGDNNLEDAAIADFLEMASVGSSDQVKILVLMDRTSGYDTTYGDWTGTRRGLISAGNTPTASWGADVGEKNMGNPQTLIDFVLWGIQNYPANKYAVVLWDHGGGWRLSQDRKPVKAICWDDSSGGDCLYMAEVSSALATIHSSTSAYIDLFGFDACVMGMIEVGYEIRNYANVMVASEDNEPWDGWPYHTLLDDLVTSPTITPAQFGAAIADRYHQYYTDGQTLAAIDLTQMNALASQVSSLAQSLRDNWQSTPSACATAATQAKTALQSAVIHEMHGADWTAHGLTIYFPDLASAVSSDYNASIIQFPGAVQWDEFLDDFQSDMENSWVDTVRGNTFDFFGSDNVDLGDFCDKIVKYAPQGLYVTPFTPYTASGGNGSPWTPASATYTLTNYHSATVIWTATPAANWLAVAPATGSLAPGASMGVTLSVNASAAAGLASGSHITSVTFANNSGVAAPVREAQLMVFGMPPRAFYWFPLNYSPNWSCGAGWAFGQPQGAGSHNGDPASGCTGSNVYGVNLSGDYANNITAPQYLTTPAFDCSGFQNVRLSFWRWLGVESNVWDAATVEVSNNGTDWTLLWNNPASSISETEWTLCEYDISAVADGHGAVYVRWGFASDDAVSYPGWNIDDVALSGDLLSGASCPARGQAQIIASDGRFFAAAWSFAQSDWIGSTDTTAAGAVCYTIPQGSWVGVYIYDYASATYTEAMYVYRDAVE